MVGVSPPDTWTRAQLEKLGFSGFVRFQEIKWSSVPSGPGIYVVVRSHADQPSISELTARAYRPYPVADLRARWLPAAEIVYIGKAGGASGLRGRLRPYAGRARNHSGGRSIWQLDIANELLVAWLETPGESPTVVERDFIAAFRELHGQRPFANRLG